jgi:putative (di)nucleoside polyphosphate hydrolase
MTENINIPAQYFRAGAGGMIINDKGLVLSLERADIPGSWQMAQGGMDYFEEPLTAALREIAEETNIQKNDLELLDSYPEPLAYELPPEARSIMTGRGQVQFWYLFKFIGNDKFIDVISGKEFRNWKWLNFQTLLSRVVDFRKPLYRKLAERFHQYIVV